MPLGKAFVKPKGESNGRFRKTGPKKIRRASKGVAPKGVSMLALISHSIYTLGWLLILPEDPQDHRREHRSSSGVPNEGCSGTPLVERCSGIVSVFSVSS